jgi:hypothetical protein
MNPPRLLKLPPSNVTSVAYLVEKLSEHGIEFPEDLAELYEPEKFAGPVLRVGKLNKFESDLFCLRCGLASALSDLTTTLNVEALQKNNQDPEQRPDRLVSEDDLFQLNMLNLAMHLATATYEWSARSRLNVFTRRIYVAGTEFEVYCDA